MQNFFNYTVIVLSYAVPVVLVIMYIIDFMIDAKETFEMFLKKKSFG